MAIVLFEVDARYPGKLHDKLIEQQSLRAVCGEVSFSMCIDDNARHISFVFLRWESLASAQRFLESKISHDLVAQWPIEEVLGAIPLRDYPSE